MLKPQKEENEEAEKIKIVNRRNRVFTGIAYGFGFSIGMIIFYITAAVIIISLTGTLPGLNTGL